MFRAKMDAIEIRGVTKTFATVTAVNDLSLAIPEGSIYGFIGPNGSGKTTTMRMIAGIIRTAEPFTSSERTCPQNARGSSATCRKSAAFIKK
jgi:ABC-type multidrug transport system ATPase subunit